MLTPEQLGALKCAIGFALSAEYDAGYSAAKMLMEHIDSQAARIAELEQRLAAAENFAGCAKIELERAQEQLTAAVKDAARYRLLRQGRHWSIIDGIGDELRGEKLDAATDAAMHPNP